MTNNDFYYRMERLLNSSAPEAPLPRTRRSEEGSAFVITLLVMAITLAMGLALVTSGVTELDISGNYRSRATAYYAADSGLEQTIVDLGATTTWIEQVIDTTTWTIRDPFPTSITIGGQTVSLAVDGNGNVIADYYAFGSTTTLGNGTFTREIYLPPTVVMSGTKPVLTFRVRSTGAGGNIELAEQIVRADIRPTINIHGVWDNAIFADAGAVGNSINGHVAVRGSIHVLGNESSPPTIEFGGSGDIRNNYSDAVSWFGATDAAKLPSLPTVEVNGVTAETLNTVIRTKDASISLTGNADIGAVNDDSNTIKEMIDAVRSDGTVGPSAEVHTDDTGSYDTDQVVFPLLSDPYVDPATGISYSSQADFLDTTSLTITENEISANTSAFSHSDGNGNSISWDPDSLTMIISGLIRVVGIVRLGRPHGQPGLRGVNYVGTGTIYATDDIHIDGYVVPVGNYITDGNLGLIAADDVLIDEASNVNVMAAIYGQDHIRVSKQTAIAGAMVSKWFDMGTNVPAMFHVPALSSSLPPGMPGDQRFGSIESIALENWFQESGQ